MNLHISTSIPGSLQQDRDIQTYYLNFFESGTNNFNTACELSVATTLVLHACTRQTRSSSRRVIALLILKPKHKLGSSCQMTSNQNKTEQPFQRLTKEHVKPETLLHPIVDCLRNIEPYLGYDTFKQGYDELPPFQKQHRKPLQLVDF